MKKGNRTTGKREIDMIHGTIGSKTMRFALPLAVTGILQQLFNAADIAVIGQFCGKQAMAAVGSNSPVVGIMVTMFIGISLGANVVIARFTGRGDEAGVRRGVHTSILLALLFGCGMMVFGELIASPLLRLLDVPEEIMAMAMRYLRIYLIGLPVIFLYNFESAIFRSQGDTKTPLICLTISGVVNVGLNLFFVLVVGLNVEGVALATVIANLVSSTMLFWRLTHYSGLIRVRRAELRIDRSTLRAILRIGLPSGLQNAVFSISNLCIQSAINSLGSDVIAASSAAFNIEIFVYYVTNSFGQAVTTFIGQNYGAEDYRRCRRVTRICLLQDMIVTVAAAFLILGFGHQLLHLFNSDPTVIEVGYIRLTYILSGEALSVLIEIFSGSMRGYGYSALPAFMSLIGVVGVRIGWVFIVFPHYRTFASLVVVYPISWAVTSAALIAVYFILRHRRLDPYFARRQQPQT